jgi:hypothetical protein
LFGSEPLRLICVLLALLLLGPRAHIFAQTPPEPSAEELQLARSLYYDGLELLDKGEWEQAADRLQRVLQIRDSAVVSLHLANAYSHLKRHVEARLLLQRVLNDTSASPEIRKAAGDLLPAVEREMGRLTVRLVGDLEGVEILIDGRPTPPAAMDVPVPVDPRDVSVVALRDGVQVAQATASVGGDAGLQVQLTLEIPPRDGATPVLTPSVAVTAVPAGEGAPRASEPDRAEKSGGVLGKWWFWTAIGVVAAGAVITAVALSSSSSPSSDTSADLSSVRGDLNPGLIEGRVE